MKRKIIITISIILPIILLIIWLYIKPYFSHAIQQEEIFIKKHNDDTIRIAYIGDSWAEYHKYFPCKINDIVQQHTQIATQTKISGISGLTSKNVYYSIFRNDSVRKVIEWGPNYCFVVAGINDTDRKMGKLYYKENMRLIISFLLDHHIIPIILEIPDYDIKYSFKRRNRLTKLKYIASMIITWSKMDCIESYRQELKNLIEEENWHNMIIYISKRKWNPDGYKDSQGIYDEGRMHLNLKGYQKLDSCIADAIISHINSN